MGNYKQDKVTGWQRSRSVHIENAYQAVPTIEFKEEFIVEMDGQLINKKDVGSVASSLKDPSVTFDLLNPENDAVIGTGSYGQAYVLLYSIYRYLADKRDFRDIKWQELVAVETPYKEAKAALDKLSAIVLKAQQDLSRDPESGVFSKALSDAMYAKQDALDAIVEKETAYNAAKAAFDAASDYL